MPAAPSAPTYRPATPPQRRRAGGAEGGGRASSPSLYASQATFVTPVGVDSGETETLFLSNEGHERSINESPLDHPDRRTRACTAGLFRPRPLLVGRTELGIGPSGTRRAAFFARLCGHGLAGRRTARARRRRRDAPQARGDGTAERRRDRERAPLGIRDDDW